MAPKKNKNTDEITVNEEVAAEAVEAPVVEAPVVEALPQETVDNFAAIQDKKASEMKATESHFRYMRELVAVTPAPPRMGEDPNYPIGINGKLWLLPKGKTSMVPRYVADAFNQAEAAKGTQIENQAQLLKQQSGPELDLSSLTEAQIAQLKQLLGI